MHEVHETFMMVVVMCTLGSIDRQHEIVGTQTMALSVRVREDTSLEHLVITVINSRHYDSRAESQLLILREKVIDVPVQHHPSYRLHKSANIPR